MLNNGVCDALCKYGGNSHAYSCVGFICILKALLNWFVILSKNTVAQRFAKCLKVVLIPQTIINVSFQN